MPEAAMAASSAAIWRAWSWWLAATCTVFRVAWAGNPGHLLRYVHSVNAVRRSAPAPLAAGPVAGYIASWRPSSVPPGAAVFARQVVAQAAPHSRDRAKNLLWAAGKLAGYGTGLGLEPAPEVLLHPSVIERFTAHGPGLSGPARRTLRTNLRFLARAVVPQLAPADAPLPRERAKAPYSAAEIDGY